MTIRTRPKGPQAKARAAKARKDAAYAKKIRQMVFDRDQFCRVGRDCGSYYWCAGDPGWAHVGDLRRFKTRGMAPTDRHSTAYSLMLCTKHHGDYDARKMDIVALTDRFCDGPLEFVRGSAKA